MKSSDQQQPWDEFLNPNGEPLDQSQSEWVILFAQGDKGGTVTWWKTLYKLVCIPKYETTVTQVLNGFVNLCLHTVAPDTVGFQLEAFSHFVPRIWEMLGRGLDARVSLGEILLYYEGIVLGASAKDREIDTQFQLDKMRELRDLFGHVTILQPEHARTIAL